MNGEHDLAGLFTVLGAGRWFPSDPARLRTMVLDFMAAANQERTDLNPVAAVAPHAGYTYSGPVAGYVYRALRDASTPSAVPRTVVILGGCHRQSFSGLSLLDADRIGSPLGTSPIDRQVTDELVRAVPGALRENEPHRGEHSVENQVPFVQVALPSARLVLALFGDHDRRRVDALAEALDILSRKRHLTVIASTDLLHDPDHERVRRTDLETLDILASLDEQRLIDRWSYDHQPVCGLMPVLTAMRFAKLRGAAGGTVLAYRNSGDDYPHTRGEWVVGYGAVVFGAA